MRVKDGGWRRHLEGWPGAVVALGLGVTGVLLGTPRAAWIDEVPLPVADGRQLRAVAERDRLDALAMAASPEQDRGGAGFELRQLGGWLREYGEADAGDDPVRMNILRPDMLRRAHDLLAREPAALVQLRAFQQQIFLREVERWEQTGKVSAELRQVGGGVVKTVVGSGWAAPPGRGWGAPVEVRVALFKRRFAEVLGLAQAPGLAPQLDEGRALYAYLLASPPVADGGQAWLWRLRKVDELSGFDPLYPRRYARGVILLRLGQGPEAVSELREHLAQHPDGPSTLRARNALVAALELAESQGLGGL